MPFSTVGEAVNFVFDSFNRAGMPSGPDAELRRPDLTEQLLTATGLQSPGVPVAVVTGSKGKGSTAVSLARVLQAAGHRTGLVTSPHLRDFRERIRLNGRAISIKDFLQAANEVEDAARRIAAGLAPPTYLGPNGIILAIALNFFRRAGTTALVLEAGRGGAYDDSNVVPHLVAVITPIYREHVRQLGPELTDIAAHKAGVIGTGNRVISAPQQPGVLAVLKGRCRSVDAYLSALGRDIYVQARPVAGGRCAATVQTPARHYPNLPVRLPGRHQTENLAIALAAAEALEPAVASLDLEVLQRALNDVRWPGRIERLAEAPAIIVDAAVTEESARLAIEATRDTLTAPVVALLAVPADKDLPGVCRAVADVADAIILTETRVNRTLRYANDSLITGVLDRPIYHCAGVREALAQARALAGPDGTILALGTISLLTELFDLLDHDCLDLW